MKEGCTLGLEAATDVIQSKSSFVAYERGIIDSIIHTPIYKMQSWLLVYQYPDIPVTTSHDNNAIIIQPIKPILAMNLQNRLFTELSTHEFEQSCQRSKVKYFCSDTAVLKRPQQKMSYRLVPTE